MLNNRLISRLLLGSAATLALLGQTPQPTCKNCQATYIPKSELDAYTAKEIKYNQIDLQVRDIDLGKATVGIGMVHRGKLTVEQGKRAGLVAEHEQVSEVYHVIDGEATLVTGSGIVNPKKRSATERTVIFQNGPGFNGDSITNPETHHLKAGDMIVIPAGTGHWFTEIPDHITYMMVRIDPDKILPLKSREQSEADLKTVPEAPDRR